MRKIILFMLVSLDGFFEGPNHDLSWHNVDEEFNRFAINQLQEIDTLLFGRTTYEMMASYWPTENAKKDDPIVAGLMNNTPKIVFSHALEKIDWANTTLIKENVAQEISKLRNLPGKDIAIFGSNNLSVHLMSIGLLDELRIMVNPVVLGKGRILFDGIHEKYNLKFLNAKTFKNGNVLLYYTTTNRQV